MNISKSLSATSRSLLSLKGSGIRMRLPNKEGKKIIEVAEASPAIRQLSDVSTFLTLFGGSSDDEGYSIQETVDGGFIVTGYTTGYGAGNEDVLIAKLDSSGSIIWSKAIGGSSDDLGYSIQQTGDGGFVLTGYTGYGAGENDALVAKLDSSGSIIWAKAIGGSSTDVGYSIQQTGDEGFMITGYTFSYGAGSVDVLMAKLSNSGSLIWAKAIGGSNTEYGRSLQQTGDGGLVLTGYTASDGAGNWDVLIAKLSSSGSLIWSKAIGGSSSDYGRSIQKTVDGGFIITGYTRSYGAGSVDALIIKLASSGSLIWSKAIGGSGADYGISIQETGDGGFVLTGYTTSYGAGNWDVLITKLSSNGSLIWSKAIGGPSTDYGESIQETDDGGFVLTGYITGFGTSTYDALIAKLDASGHIQDCSSQISLLDISPTVTDLSPTVTDLSPTVTNISPTITDLTGIITSQDISLSESTICPATQLAAQTSQSPRAVTDPQTAPISEVTTKTTTDSIATLSTSDYSQNTTEDLSDFLKIIRSNPAILSAIIIPSLLVVVVVIILSIKLKRRNVDLFPVENHHPNSHKRLQAYFSRMTDQAKDFQARLNDLLGRVSAGKYQTAPEFTPVRAKTAGCAPGAFYTKTHSSPRPKQAPLKEWIGKCGVNNNGQQLNINDSRSSRSALVLGIHADAYLEKIGNDAFLYLSNDQFITPKSRLMKAAMLNEFTRDNQLIGALLEAANHNRNHNALVESIHVFSKLVPNYQDLSRLIVQGEANRPMSFSDYVTTYQRIPSLAIIDNQTVPIKGLIPLLAASALVADTDSLGGGFNNAGFVPIYENGRLDYVKLVKIDPGYAFNFEGIDNKFFQSFNREAHHKLKDRRDLQFGNNMSKLIKWSHLTPLEQNQFVVHLYMGLNALKARENKLNLFYRNGLFNAVCDVQLTPDIFDDIIKKFEKHLNRLQRKFQADLDRVIPIIFQALPPV